MNRRSALKHVVLISAGAIIFDACRSTDKTYLKLKNLSLTGSQYDLLAAMSETIIPSGGSYPGAKELKADEFILTMVDDCAKPEDRDKFISGMKAFEEASKKSLDKSFVKASPEARLELLKTMEAQRDSKDEAVEFYKRVRRLTVQSFTSSQKYMTEVMHYKIIPGSNFKGCAKV